VVARDQSGCGSGGGGQLLGGEVLVMLDPQWRTSTRSQDTNCVEIALIDGEVLVRDTKNRQALTLAIPLGQWREFVEAVKDGDFDR
jgi:hypothetical protein